MPVTVPKGNRQQRPTDPLPLDGTVPRAYGRISLFVANGWSNGPWPDCRTTPRIILERLARQVVHPSSAPEPESLHGNRSPEENPRWLQCLLRALPRART